jgi:hypothetical protein
VSVTSLKKWGREWNEKIQELGRVRLATFVDEQLMTMEKRLELRAEQIQRMRDELSARDLSQLDDATLLRIYLRYVDAAGKEIDPVKVEVVNPLATYERVLVQCLEVPEGTRREDIPDLAAKMADGTAVKKRGVDHLELEEVDQELPKS